MLHEVGVQLAQSLQAKGCPFPVIDGPEFRPTDTGARERVVIQHDDGDGFVSRHMAKGAPNAVRLTRNQMCKLLIYAKAPSAGAMYWEHTRRAEHVLDLVLISLFDILKARRQLFEFKSGKFIFPDDLQKSETPALAVYELSFMFDRGVFYQKWDGSGAATATIVATQASPPVPGQVVIANSTTAADPAGDTESV